MKNNREKFMNNVLDLSINSEKINKQYENICELADKFNMTIDEILCENIRKLNHRYNEKGEKIDNEQEK